MTSKKPGRKRKSAEGNTAGCLLLVGFLLNDFSGTLFSFAVVFFFFILVDARACVLQACHP
jgi:hypothetical protein